nr:reverse transcriptase [Tanacetum cinerariifolium]
MVRKSVTEGHIHGVKVCREAPEISHMFFADDNIFFTRSSVEKSCKLKSIFTRYCQASGQVINYEKSKISFSANVDIHIRTRIIECLNVREVVHQDKYIGLPSVIGRSKKVAFEAILDRIKKKLEVWVQNQITLMLIRSAYLLALEADEDMQKSRMGDFHDDIVGTVDEKKQTLSWSVEW